MTDERASEDWPGKDDGRWSPEAQALRRKFFAEFREGFDAHLKRLGYGGIARKAGSARPEERKPMPMKEDKADTERIEAEKRAWRVRDIILDVLEHNACSCIDTEVLAARLMEALTGVQMPSVEPKPPSEHGHDYHWIDVTENHHGERHFLCVCRPFCGAKKTEPR